MSKVMAALMMLVGTILLLILIPFAISSARIDSWLVRAKDAGNPAQVSEFLGEYRTALQEAGRVEGKFYTVFHYPGSYMPTYIRAVDGLVQRANALALQSPQETSYQMGLVNLEKDLGDIEAAAYDVWFAYTGVWLEAAGLVLLVGGFLLGIFLVW